MEEDEENSEWLLVDTSSKFNLTFFVLILIKFSIIDTWSISIFHRRIYDGTFHIAYEYKDHWDQSLSFLTKTQPSISKQRLRFESAFPV